MEIIEELMKAVRVENQGSARSRQTNIGPSEVGGCRRRTWLKLQGQPKVNETLRFPAMYGTAIHNHILDMFKKLDPFGERYLLESEFTDEETGLVGHIDCYDKETGQVIDWKSTKKNNLRYFPSQQQRWQVQLYGYLVQKAGMKIETVTLVALPRDGDERDIVYHSEPYDYQVVQEAFAWLDEVKVTQIAPPAEKDPTLCQGYCPYYDATGTKGCAGRPKVKGDIVSITDNSIDYVAKEYVEITKTISQLEAQKDAIKEVLAGISGTTESGLTITWSQVGGRKTIDEEALKNILEEIPYKYGKPSERLTIK